MRTKGDLPSFLDLMIIESMDLKKQAKQVVSKKRVCDHGEVYTGKREVNAMLDLVKHETERIESRFLEPACGTGNFLIEILKRKLRVVETRYRRNQLQYQAPGGRYQMRTFLPFI